MSLPTPSPHQPALPFVQERDPCQELDNRAAPYRWKCPTVGEFMRRVEREFGHTLGSPGLYATGPASDELLSPSAMRAFCEQIGVPPEDFGV